MRFIRVKVGVSADFGRHTQLGRQHRKSKHRNRIFTILVVENLYLVVARHLQTHIIIGNCKLIMGVKLCGVLRIFPIIDGTVVETIDIIYRMQVGSRSVGIAVRYTVYKTFICMRKFVERE